MLSSDKIVKASNSVQPIVIVISEDSFRSGFTKYGQLFVSVSHRIKRSTDVNDRDSGDAMLSRQRQLRAKLGTRLFVLSLEVFVICCVWCR